jgi:2,5-diamino-6-(ribosylamino)-4(3H)-pyrimidinone 5'-phosphate reductase
MEIDPGLYYSMAASIGADGMLAGSKTMLAAAPDPAPEEPSDMRKPDPSEKGDVPYWFIVDSRGTVRNLHAFRRFEFCKDVVALVSESTPKDHLDYLREREYDIVQAGEDKVDLVQALDEIGIRYGVELLRVDSGGVLNSILLQQGLVDELSLLMSPTLVGNETPHFFQTLRLGDRVIGLELLACEALEGSTLLLRYGIK